MAEVEMRFFCHQCSRNIPRVAADFTCPTCNSGFIEELGQGAGSPGGGADQDQDDQHQDGYDLGEVLGPLEGLLGPLLGQQGPLPPRPSAPGPPGMMFRGGSNIRISTRRGTLPRPRHLAQPGAANLGMDQAALENALQDFVFNLAGMQFGGAPGGGGGARVHFMAPGQGGFHGLHGNPGDYAWGRGGLDTIITQLLNQMDGAGPPPMASDTISAIPSVKIDQKVLEKNANCAVCFEDFSLGEEARLLECGHCFHTDCIVPWLELHGTCPVCRKVLDPNGAASTEQPETTQNSDNTTSSSSSSSSSNNSSSTASVPPNVTSPSEGGGGLTGIIQSAINQVFRGSNWSATSQPQSGGAESATTSSTRSQPPTEQLRPEELRRNNRTPPDSDNNGANRSTSTSTDDETPAPRRPRLDSDFVDFDFD